jgi:hypothetical protein
MTAPISATPWDLAAGNKWSIDSENHDFAGDSGNEVIVDANGSVVAYVAGGMENGNGALLAAAPALVAALRECAELFSAIRGDWTDPRHECRAGQEVISAALKQAGAL